MVIGTAGHVDHGKSTLIKSLTGIETDTTEEEKIRGMSINIGFAYFNLPNGLKAGIVDVPGHEKFIKNMIAGLAGLNLILLVIDVNEGIMPQTREHIDILQLLGIKDFIIVLSKVGIAEKELIELVEDDIKEQFTDTILETAPIIKVDSIVGLGLDELKLKINEMNLCVEQKNTLLPPRMHADRVFSIKGFGTVVTGTLTHGKVKIGDELMIYPAEISTKIRGIQVHGELSKEAFAGQRVALNLTNIALDEINRGDTLSHVHVLHPSFMFDVKVKVLPHSTYTIGLWDRLRLHIGTREILCRAVPLGVDKIAVGEEGFLQLRLEERAVAIAGDKCIIRYYSPMETIAGAVILDTNPAKHKRFDNAILNNLAIKESGKPEDLLLDFIAHHTSILVSFGEIINYMGLENDQIKVLLTSLLDGAQIVDISGWYMHRRSFEEIKADINSKLDRYHKDYRLRVGIPKEELRSKIEYSFKGKEFDLILKKLAADKIIKMEDAISLKEFEIKYNAYQLKDIAVIKRQLKEAKFTPLSIEALIKGKDEKRELIESLNKKTLIRLDDDAIIDATYYLEAVNKVREFININGSMTLADFRDMMNSSRKYSMIILEYMDKEKVTRRTGNTRVLC